MKRIWREIMDAFPFFLIKRIGGIAYSPYIIERRELHITIQLPAPIRIINIQGKFIL